MKQRLYILIDLVLFSCLYSAFCALALSMATEKLVLGKNPPVVTWFHGFVFGSTLMVYNAHYALKKIKPGKSDHFGWSVDNKMLHIMLLAIGGVISFWCLLYLPKKVWWFCGVLGVLSFGYSLPVLPFKNKRRFKDFGWLKIILLTSIWSIVTSILPIVLLDKHLSDYPWEIAMRFFLLFTLCIAFDVRDMHSDAEAGIKTLPNIIGVDKSYFLIDRVLSILFGLALVQFWHFRIFSRLIVEMITIIAINIAVYYTKKHPSDRAYLGLVDGCMLLNGVLLILI